MVEKAKAGRPAKWSGPTTPIRVPQYLAPHLLAIARELDTPESVNNVQNPRMLTSESPTGTYRLFLKPPPELAPSVEASIEEYCDRVFDGLTETDWVYLLTRLVEEWGVKVDV